jgi:hypothetical protein
MKLLEVVSNSKSMDEIDNFQKNLLSGSLFWEGDLGGFS